MKLSEISKFLEKDYPDMIETGDKLKAENLPRIATDVFSFDLLTGGGIPEDRTTIFHGGKSSGKTTMAIRVCDKALTLSPKGQTAYVDFEKSLDALWVHKLVSPENRKRFNVYTPDYGEQGVDMIMEIAAAEDIVLIVVDSLAMMIPTKEAEASASDDFVGQQARLANKLFRKYIPLMSKLRKSNHKLTLLIINHVRTKIGTVGFRPQSYKPCGVMQDMIASLDVRFFQKDVKKLGKIPIKVIHTFRIEKSKIPFALAKRSGEYMINMVDRDDGKAGTVDDYATVIEYAKRAGFLVREGKWKLGKNHTFSNLTEIEEFLRKDTKAFAKLKEATLKACIENVFLSSDGKEGEEGEKDND